MKIITISLLLYSASFSSQTIRQKITSADSLKFNSSLNIVAEEVLNSPNFMMPVAKPKDSLLYSALIKKETDAPVTALPNSWKIKPAVGKKK